MANTITVSKVERGTNQFQGAFKEMWKVRGTISTWDTAVAATAIGEIDCTVPGVTLGDMVLGIAISEDLDDGTDQASLTAYVAAANTVTVQISADDAEFANNGITDGIAIKMLIGRPSW
jgi:hypothetical protein